MMKPTLFLATLFLAQAVPAQQSLPTGSIEGTVVKVGTTETIPKARVTLAIVQGSGTAQGVTADGDGKFAIRNLPPGQYRLTATRDSYVSGSYGQRGPNGSGATITLGDRQQLKDIRIAMTPSGAIAGRIINRDGEPVGNANVQALRYVYQDGRRSLVAVQTVTTNDLGEYRLFWMPPGQYIVSAQPVQPLSLDAGGTFFVQTTRGGGPAGLAGAVGAQLGVAGVQRITVTGANAGALDFNGGPGGAAPPPPPPPVPAGVAGIGGYDPDVAYLPVYYPGTTDVATATAIDLRAGGTITGVNMTAAEVRPVRIRGQVLNGGRPAAGTQVSIFQAASANGNLTIRSVNTSDTGAFEFRSVAPGSYDLVATMNAAGPAAMIVGGPLGNAARVTAANIGGRNPNQPTLTARAHVDVGASDLDSVSLVLETAFNINGRVTTEGRPTSDTDSSLTSVRVQLQSDPAIPPLSVAPANPEANGSFTIIGVAPGNYRVSAAGLPRNSYVKSALFNGVDVMNGGLRIEGEPRGSLDIVLGTTPGALDVTTLDDKLMPASGVTVALVPDGAQQKRYDMYRNATSDASGKIHWDGVVPGSYRVFAWEDIENSAWTDAEFMRSYEGRGTPVRVGEGSRNTIDVKVIPFKVN